MSEKNEFDDFESELKKLSEKHKRTVSSLQQQLKDTQLELDQLKQIQLPVCNKSNAQMEDFIVSLQKKIDEMHKQIVDHRDVQAARLRNEIKQLRTDIAEAQKEVLTRVESGHNLEKDLLEKLADLRKEVALSNESLRFEREGKTLLQTELNKCHYRYNRLCMWFWVCALIGFAILGFMLWFCFCGCEEEMVKPTPPIIQEQLKEEPVPKKTVSVPSTAKNVEMRVSFGRIVHIPNSYLTSTKSQ